MSGFLFHMTRIYQPVYFFILILIFLAKSDFAGQDQLALWNKNFLFKQISQDQGLPGINMVDLIQDSNGLMWFSIESMGLARYDGHKFVLFRNEPNNPNSISSNYINQIAEDSVGNLWLPTECGVTCFNPEKNSYSRFYCNFGDNHSLPSNVCKTAAFDDQNHLWIGTENGLALKTETGFSRYLSLPDSLLDSGEPYSIQYIYPQSGGLIWLGTRRGLVRFNPETGKVRCWSHSDQNGNTPIHDLIHVIREDQQGYLWLGTHRGLDRFDPKTEKFVHWNYRETFDQFDLEQEGVNAICIDKTGIIWVGTYTKGFVLIDPQSNSYIRINGDNNKSLQSNHIRVIYEDQHGLIWIGTKFEGVFIYNDHTNLFSKWPKTYEAFFPVRNKYLLSVYEDRDSVFWLGSKLEGVYRVDVRKNKIQHWEHRPGDPNSLSSNRIQAFVRDQSGHLWIGTEAGLNMLDEQRGTVTHFSSFSVTALLCDRQGKVWVGTSQGIFQAQYGRNELIKLNQAYYSDNFFSNNNIDIAYIFQDSDDMIWFSTRQSGLFVYNPHNHQLIELSDPNTGYGRFLSYLPRGIAEDGSGRIWIGSKDMGIFLFDRKKRTFTNYSTIQGLPSNMIINIEPYPDGTVWLGTHNGITKFDEQKGTIVNFNSNYGIFSQIVELGVHHRFDSGELLFGGNNGFNIFHPNDLNIDFHVPPMILTSIKSFDDELVRNISKDQVIHLKHRQNYLSFEFTLPDYKNPFKHEYAIKMEGVDPDWKHIGNRNFASYTNLQPGVYQFSVKGANDLGRWCEKPLIITLMIKPPLYKSLLFRIAVILIVLVCSYLIYRQIKGYQAGLERLVKERTAKLEHAFDELFEKNVMINRQKAEIEAHHNQLELKVKERTRDLEEARQKAVESDRLKSSFLANMSHEIRTPLNAITGFSTLICNNNYPQEKREKYVGIVKSNANSLLKLVEDILDISKIEAGQLTIHKDFFDVKNMMAELHAVFLQEFKCLKKSDVELISVIPDHLTDILLFYSDPIRIRQILINLLGNAMKFTHAGKIEFGFRLMEPEIEFWVKDTGIGISVLQQDQIFNRFIKIEEGNTIYRGTGLGLSISKSLVELLGGRIQVESQPGKGSCFSFHVPGDIKWVKSSVDQVDQLTKALNLNHLSILIVEDERSNYELLHSFLSGRGAQVVWASDGAMAVSFCEKQHFDLVFIDIRMPGMDGYQTLQKIREIWPAVLAIAQTAFAQFDDRRKMEEAGFNDILVKPFLKDDVFRTLAQHLPL